MTVAGDPFLHRVYVAPGSEEVAGEGRAGARIGSPTAPDAAPLHVYLAGDGSPPAAIRHRPPDPTPRPLLALELMARDPNPSIFLGRPCYHGVEACDPRTWSLGRYSASSVRSLAAALRQVVGDGRPTVLVGVSGGGTLAMLLARERPGVVAVVTVAGNLDVAAFVAHHGFVPFEGSLDPARLPPLGVPQLHLVGGRDRVVPPELVADEIRRQPLARMRRYPDHTHGDGWVEAWPAVLDEVRGLVGVSR